MIIVDGNMSNLELEQFTYTQEAGIANKYDEKGTQLIQIPLVIRATDPNPACNPCNCPKRSQACVAGWVSYGLSVLPTVSCIRRGWW